MLRSLRYSERHRIIVLAVIVVLLMSSGLVYRASSAAFTATTANSASAWTAGTVALSDDDSGTSMFSLTGLIPGSYGSKCIVVSYSGNLASTVSLYASVAGTLGPYINLTIESGTGGTFAEGDPCSTFSSSATLFTGTLTAFGAASTNFTTGVPAAGSRWAPSSASTRVFRFSYTVADDNAGQGLSATATFTWEARNS